MKSRINTKGCVGQLSAPQPLLCSQELSAPNVHTAEVEKFASFFSFPSVLLLPSLFVSAFFSLALIISICFHVWLSLTRNCTFREELIVWFTYVSTACRTVPDTVVRACSVVSDSLQPHDLSPPGSSVHEIFQARILE